MHPNSSFSALHPHIQLVWDSTSLGWLKTCPRLYWHYMIRQKAPRSKSDDLTFGLILHGALERYHHTRSRGEDAQAALESAFRWALGRCGTWASTNTTKNPFTLLRTLVWYLDTYEHETFRTAQTPSGLPMVEWSFRIPSGFTTQDGEAIFLAGHLDRVATLGPDGPLYILDTKTTKSTIDGDYFASYSPDNQFSLYTWAGTHEPEAMFPGTSLQLAGFVIDAIQVAVGFSRFSRAPIARTPGQLEEWYADLGVWIALAETYARAGHWPMNDKACFRCPFRGVCSKDPSIRDLFLDSPDFEDFIWDPSQPRTAPT